MRDGIYHVRFTASSTDNGEGLVVIKQGAVNGGDNGYFYRGESKANGDAVAVRLHVKKWRSGAVSVFGSLDDFELQLTGKSTPDGGFRASGGVTGEQGLTITIDGRYISPAA